ncbi:P-loop containing nucleoside triphosphate hydrolase protein [Kockiozyma suomiensis]|uniref:P-loop containing nucleoside triphosphate hydrolase protein n=1 Tax=Kockiozyma suomiensis TaxID=1337062 RepID=UPI003343FD9B
MSSWFSRFYEYILSLFWSSEMDITLLGLQNAGKTSLLRVLGGGEFTSDSIPTIGFSMKRVRKGRVTIKCWDLGGQPRFRSMWERYCKGVNAILFIVDSADPATLQIARMEFEALVSKPSLEGIPVLVLGNKNDLPEAYDVDSIIDIMNLKSVDDREVSCYSISAKESVNVDAVLNWLVSKSN